MPEPTSCFSRFWRGSACSGLQRMCPLKQQRRPLVMQRNTHRNAPGERGQVSAQGVIFLPGPRRLHAPPSPLSSYCLSRTESILCCQRLPTCYHSQNIQPRSHPWLLFLPSPFWNFTRQFPFLPSRARASVGLRRLQEASFCLTPSYITLTLFCFLFPLSESPHFYPLFFPGRAYEQRDLINSVSRRFTFFSLERLR